MTGSSIPSTTLSNYADAALSQALVGMRPGWILLRDCMLGADGDLRPARVQYALLHMRVGIALLDIIPGPTTPNAAARFRRQLDAAGCSEKFFHTPEIRYLCVPLRVIPDLALLLDQEFSPHPAFMLPCSEAWVALAQSLLLPQSPQPVPEVDTDDQLRRRDMRESQLPAGRRSVRLQGSTRWLGVLWGLVATTVSVGVLLLQYLGPPAERRPIISAKSPDLAPGIRSQPKAVFPLRKAGSFAGVAPAALHPANEAAAVTPVSDAAGAPYATAIARDLIDAELQRAMAENDQAIAEIENRLKNFEPEVSAGLGTGATTAIEPSDHPSTWPATTLERSVPAPAPTLAEEVEDPPTQPSAADEVAVPPPDEPLPTTAAPAAAPPPATATDLVKPADAPPIDAPSPPQADSQEVPLVPPAAVDADTPSPPSAEPDPVPVQDSSQPHSPDVSPSTPSPASTTEAPVSIEPPPSHDPEAAPPAAAPTPTPTSTLAETMIRRADTLLQRGDVSAARLLYERAAAAGSGHAAMAMGKTFEATFLAAIGARGLSADPALAAAWYRRALDLGDPEARTRLQAVPPATSRTSTTQDGHP